MHSPNRAAAARRAALPGSGLLALLAMLLAVLVAAGSCRPGRTVPRLPDVTSVRVLLLPAPGQEAPRSARGRAGVRLRVGDRDLPALSLSFSLREASGVGAVLRPGVLAPVLSLWAGADGWALRLPREKAAFELEHEPGITGMLRPCPEASPDSGLIPTGPAVGRICSWVLVPQALLEDIAGPAVRREGEAWVVAGSAASMGAFDLEVEAQLTAQEGAVLRWSLKSRGSTPLIRVEYDPPRTAGVGRAGQRIHFELAPLGAAGTLTLDHIRADVPDLQARPRLPDGWARYAGSELGPALVRLQESLQANP